MTRAADLNGSSDERMTDSGYRSKIFYTRLIWFLSKAALPFLNGLIASLIFYQVFARYFFNNPPSWTEEVARFSMIWMTFLGVSITVVNKNEIALRGGVGLFGPGAKRWLLVLKDLLLIIFLFVTFYQSVPLLIQDRFTITAALEMSWSWIYLALTVGFFLYCLIVFPEFFRHLYREKGLTLVISMFLAGCYFLGIKLQLFFHLGFSLVALTPLVMLFLFLIEMPVGFALGATCFYYLLVQGGIPLMLMPRSFTHGANSFTIMALPLFVLAAELMNNGGITHRIVRFTMNIVGPVRGGLGHVAVLSNMVMAGISGSALADTAATGSILIPEMQKKGFSRGFASAVIVASGAIGPVIPPSIFFIIYGGLGNVSIYKLFLAGAVPGFIMGIFLMIVVYLVARKRNYPVQTRANWSEIVHSLKDGFFALVMPFAVLGGMVAGVFTATEAGSIAVFYALVLGLFYRKLNLRTIWGSLTKTAITVSSILIVVSIAHLLSYIANRTQVPHMITEMLLSVSTRPWVALLIINLFLLVLGCIEAVMPILIIMTPILVPALSEIGVNPIHFGVVLTLNLLIGLMTPPHGASLFLVLGITKGDMKELIKELWPFLIALLVLLGLVTYIPEIVLFLPKAFQ